MRADERFPMASTFKVAVLAEPFRRVDEGRRTRSSRKIACGEAASEGSCRAMMEILVACDTGRGRIRGLLPEDVPVAHKTGAIGGTVNDVGIVRLPGGRGHLVLSLLGKGMTDRERAERVLADVARYAYDDFLFRAPDGDARPAAGGR